MFWAGPILPGLAKLSAAPTPPSPGWGETVALLPEGGLPCLPFCRGSLARLRNSRPWFGDGLSEASQDRIPHPIHLY